MLVAVLAAVPAAAARTHKHKHKPKRTAAQLRYQLTVSGSVSVSHYDQGLEANGAGCGLGPDDTSPFVDNYTMSLSWRTVFNVSLKRERVTVNGQTTLVSAGQYSYSGYAYDFNCHEILYGPGGQPCTGTLGSGGGAQLTARGSPARKPKRLTFAIAPFGVLVGSPGECTVDSDPGVTYTADDELGLTTLGLAVAKQFKVPVRKRAHAYRFKINQTSNCSVPDQSPGETDNCTTTYTGGGSLRVRPR
jgi:hypothetical protein